MSDLGWAGLLVALEEIKQAFVVGVEDPDRGQTVEAAVVLEHDRKADGEELRDRVKKELSAYKVPRHVFVYDDGTLPFTDTGKIDKRRLSALLRKRLHGAQAE